MDFSLTMVVFIVRTFVATPQSSAKMKAKRHPMTTLQKVMGLMSVHWVPPSEWGPMSWLPPAPGPRHRGGSHGGVPPHVAVVEPIIVANSAVAALLREAVILQVIRRLVAHRAPAEKPLGAISHPTVISDAHCSVFTQPEARDAS